MNIEDARMLREVYGGSEFEKAARRKNIRIGHTESLDARSRGEFSRRTILERVTDRESDELIRYAQRGLIEETA